MTSSKNFRINLPHIILNNYEDLDYIQGLFNSIELIEKKPQSVIIDFTLVNFIRGEMTPFLCINVRELQKKGFKVFFVLPKDNKVREFLNKNGFNRIMLRDNEFIEDYYETTIQCVEINSRSINKIDEYIENGFISKITNNVNRETSLIQDFKNSIFELADNVKTHSGSSMVTMCGQLYPNKLNLAFSICDCGNTIPKVIRNHFNDRFYKFSDSEIIEWSTKIGNTTKSDDVPGGLGLVETIKSVLDNNGVITIFSNKGYWSKSKCYIETYDLKNDFPGTMIIFSMSTRHDQQNEYVNNGNITF